MYLYYCIYHSKCIYTTATALNCELLEGGDYVTFNSKATVPV